MNLPEIKLKKESKAKKIYKTVKRKLKNRDFWAKFIVILSTLALIAASVLPYILR